MAFRPPDRDDLIAAGSKFGITLSDNELATYESLTANVRVLTIEGVDVRTLDIEGLLKTKTDYRAKDLIDREALERLRKLL